MPFERGRLLLSYSFDRVFTEKEFNIVKEVAVSDVSQRRKWKDITYQGFLNDLKKQREAQYKFDFIPKLKDVQRQRNDRELWESDISTNFVRNASRVSDRKVSTKRHADALLISAAGGSLGSDVDIYEYGRDGLEFLFKGWNEKSVKALPACEDYFFHDWGKDAICVKSEFIYIRRAFATLTPESVKDGMLESSGWIDEDEGQIMGDTQNVASYIRAEGALNPSGCPPGIWYETDFRTDEYSDDISEQKSYHLYNVTPQQEIDVFKKVFPNDWKRMCGDI